jgi:hypothetical protein
MVQLVVRLGVMRPHLFAHFPFAKGFPQVHYAQVGKIGDAGDGFQDVKAGKVAIRAADGVEEADNVVDRVNRELVKGVDAFVHDGGFLVGHCRHGDGWIHDFGFAGCGETSRRPDTQGGTRGRAVRGEGKGVRGNYPTAGDG